MATERKNPYDLTDWFEGFKSALDYMEEHPDSIDVIIADHRLPDGQGVKLQPARVRELIRWLQGRQEAAGAGLSSFGPLAYALVESPRHARKLAGAVRDWLQARDMHYSLFISPVQNHGARVQKSG